jgi:hypothetical protein
VFFNANQLQDVFFDCAEAWFSFSFLGLWFLAGITITALFTGLIQTSCHDGLHVDKGAIFFKAHRNPAAIMGPRCKEFKSGYRLCPPQPVGQQTPNIQISSSLQLLLLLVLNCKCQKKKKTHHFFYFNTHKGMRV